MTFKIGNYTIESKQGKEALEQQGINSDEELKKLDTDSDNKISNQELEDAQIEVDFNDTDMSVDEEDDSEEADDAEEADELEKTTASSSDGMTEIDALKESIEALEETLFKLLNDLNTCADIDQMDSILSTISTTESSLSSERASLVKLMSGGTTSATGATAADGTNTVDPSSITSSAGTASAIADYGMQYNGKSESEMKEIMTSKGYQFDDGQWCADFVTFCTRETYGQDAFGSACCSGSGGFGEWARSKNILMDSRETTIDLSKIKPGDYILYNASEGAVWSHIGIVTAVNSDGTVDTIEGNTGNGECATHSHVSLDGRGYGVSFVLAHNVYGS